MKLLLISESRLENETLIPTLTFQKVTEGFQEAALEDREGNRVEFTQEQLLSNSTLTIRWANGEVENCTVTEIMSALCPGCPPVIMGDYTDPTTGKTKKYVLAPN